MTDMPVRPLRVLLVDHEPRLSGGAEQALAELVATLDRERLEMHAAVVPGPLADALSAAGVTIHPLRMSTALQRVSRWEIARRPGVVIRNAVGYIGIAVRLGSLIRRVRPDVVHTNSMKAHILASLPARLSRTPLVWHLRSILPAGWLRRAFALSARVLATRIVCISRAVASAYFGGRDVPHVVVVYDGIPLTRFTRTDRDGWRRRLGAEGTDVVVGLVGEISRWKGQDVFIEAAAMVVDRAPAARFAIIGSCSFPEDEGEFDRMIHARASQLGLDDRLTWTGWVEDIPGAMSAIDVLAHTSRMPEPFGRVLVEAMACGSPVVTTTIGAGPEIVPPDAGRIVPPGDSEALATALVELISDETLRKNMGERARGAAESFGIERHADRVLDVWSSVARTSLGRVARP